MEGLRRTLILGGAKLAGGSGSMYNTIHRFVCTAMGKDVVNQEEVLIKIR